MSNADAVKKYRATNSNAKAAMKRAKENYRERHPFRMRIEWYRKEDRRKGREAEVTVKDEYLLEQACAFCQVEPAGGLHRKDSNIGHTRDNVVPCCACCNYTVGDLPWESACKLAWGLMEIRISGGFDKWLPPFVRYNQSR